jgi:hypothetical protein
VELVIAFSPKVHREDEKRALEFQEISEVASQQRLNDPSRLAQGCSVSLRCIKTIRRATSVFRNENEEVYYALWTKRSWSNN